jgi:hypothetical protein
MRFVRCIVLNRKNKTKGKKYIYIPNKHEIDHSDEAGGCSLLYALSKRFFNGTLGSDDTVNDESD